MSSRDTLERAIKRIDNTHSARNTLERSARQNFRPATSKAAAVDDVNSGTQDILEDDLIQFILPSITLSKEQITQFFGMANELKLILKFNKHLREVAKKFGRNLEECVLNNGEFRECYLNHWDFEIRNSIYLLYADSLVKVQNLPSGKEIVSETSFR